MILAVAVHVVREAFCFLIRLVDDANRCYVTSRVIDADFLSFYRTTEIANCLLSSLPRLRAGV